MPPFVQEIPWRNPLEVLEGLSPDETCFFLDSSLSGGPHGRFSILALRPTEFLQPSEKLFSTLKAKTPWQRQSAFPIPFIGGWIGAIGYEKDSVLLGFCEKVLTWDHQKKKLFASSLKSKKDLKTSRETGAGVDGASIGTTLDLSGVWGYAPTFPIKVPAGGPTHSESIPAPVSVKSNFTKEAYFKAVGIIKEYITAGDCYQVNLSQRFETKTQEDPLTLYSKLRHLSPAPYSAFLRCQDLAILSSSPESFLQIEGKKITTRPIKGTRPRGRTPAEDEAFKIELQESTKDRAELLMITDLERNDLGRFCRPGSIRVKALHDLETYANVHHLVATIEGRLEKNTDPFDCLEACFPGGSITGAPKIRAMEIIRELEPDPRGFYTGAIGYVGVDGRSQWNIAIRTMTIQSNFAFFHSGGAIVADSEPEAEYQETLTKAKKLMETLHS